MSARSGSRENYRLEGKPLDEGGQAQVFRATHKETGDVVAFKRCLDRSDDSKARMRREVEAARTFPHRHVMPVLDAAPDFSWFVMPLATSNLDTSRRTVLASDGVRDVVTAVCLALAKPHERGWVHRDLKPQNVLYLDGTWVVADWGLVRRAPGMTSFARTKLGESFGTVGFAAPELASDAHGATGAADVWAIGQMIGWLHTGQWPGVNVPLLPPMGPWRSVAQIATRMDPRRRPQSSTGLLELIERIVADAPEEPGLAGEEIIERLGASPDDRGLVDELIALIVANPGNDELLLDHFPALAANQIASATERDPDNMGLVVEQMSLDVVPEWGDRSFDWANDVEIAILVVAKRAERLENHAVFSTAVAVLIEWDGSWDRWRARDQIAAWFATLSDESAATVAAELHSNTDAAAHFRDLAGDRRVPLPIRRAVQ